MGCGIPAVWMPAWGKAEVRRTANIYYLGKRGYRSRFTEWFTMRSRMVWRKSGEVPTLWLRCTYRGLLLHEDESRSVEGPGGPPRGIDPEDSSSSALSRGPEVIENLAQ